MEIYLQGAHSSLSYLWIPPDTNCRKSVNRIIIFNTPVFDVKCKVSGTSLLTPEQCPEAPSFCLLCFVSLALQRHFFQHAINIPCLSFLGISESLIDDWWLLLAASLSCCIIQTSFSFRTCDTIFYVSTNRRHWWTPVSPVTKRPVHVSRSSFTDKTAYQKKEEKSSN